MRTRLVAVKLLISVIIPASLALGQQTRKANTSSASPEMNRIAAAFAGDWITTETMERSEFFPNGGGRHGTTHWRLATGGTTLIGEGQSDGSAGKLSYLIAIWWDKDARLYRFFTCFNGYDHPCEVRGTAHWEGDDFVNDYEELVHGKKRKFRDSFTQITPTSHMLMEAIDSSGGSMTPLISTRSIRR